MGVGHELIDNTLTRDKDGITARCKCGWVSGGHFSSGAASAMFRDHQEKARADLERKIASDPDDEPHAGPELQ